jgi:predicted nuclease of predicted toxin-antitoxin system
MLKILEIPNYESMDILFKFPILDLDDFNELSEKVSNTFMPYGILIPCLLNTECVNKKTMFDNDEELYKAVSVIIGSSLKNTPYNIDRPQGRTNVYVDCENTNIITFMKLLKFLDPMIKDCNIKLFIDSYKSKLWQHIDTILNTPVKLEKVYINRLSPSKSILDVAMASAVVADVYSNTELDNVIIVSSDSDFYNMLLSIQDKVNTYVVYSHRAVSTSYMMSLCSAGKIQTIEDNVLASEKDTQELYKKGIDYSVISYASQCIVKHFDRADLLKELRNTLGKEVVISDESVQDALDHLVINYQGDSLVLTINDLTITARKDD